MISSIEWFDDVVNYSRDKECELYIMSNVYANIGKFHRDITVKM